jgi:rhodanese-related sulfurtransferase
VNTISRVELKAKIDRADPFVLVETLSPDHFQHAHLPGAINMPPERVPELAPQLLRDKQMEVVLYCASPKCHASENAASELATLGYANVRYYPGGKQDWVTAGLPIERGATSEGSPQ